jgi:hypothetical protein
MMPRWHQGGMTMMLRKEESCDFDINTWIWNLDGIDLG